MLDPNLVLFAVEAGVKLGRKINDVLVDETAQRPLLMPLGDLVGSVTQGEAMAFFRDHRELFRAGQPCHGLEDDTAQLVQIYRAMRAVEMAGVVPVSDVGQRQLELVGQVAGLGQFDSKFGARNPVRRVFGTVVEIGIDYFATHPEAMGRDSGAKRVLAAFIGGLQDTDFAEGAGRQILADLLGSALSSLSSHTALLIDDDRLQVLFAGITGAVAEDLRRAVADGNETSRQQFFRRIGTSLLRGAAGALVSDVDLFLPDDNAALFVKETLGQVLQGLQDQEDLFNNQTLELIFKSALRTAAEHPEVMTDRKVLQSLLARTAAVLGDRQWKRLFSVETAGAVLHEALEVARENMELLVDPKRPQEQLLADALAAMAGSLSAKLAGGGSIQDLLSRRQVVELTRVVLGEVARHPEHLIGDAGGDPGKTVLAQVIASVARALGEDPTAVTSGDGFLSLVRVALQVALENGRLLIDTASASPASNALFQILRQVVTAFAEAPDPRRLWTRDTLIEVAARLLPLASANLQTFIESRPALVGETLTRALQLARGALAGRINGANLPAVAEALLHAVLWDDLSLDDAAQVKAVALARLRQV
ncbi:MAG: hypothetical protein J0L84_08605 [Verrucomicrobia bacterium]|nr:hypothetical protein [Verrucomicrobiota bacterium]